MKKLLCYVIILFFVGSLGVTTYAEDNHLKQPSDFTDDEILVFLSEYNIDIPSIYSSEGECIPFVRNVFAQILTDTDSNIPYIHPELSQFAHQIEDAVEIYCDQMNNIAVYATSTSSSILEDNTIHGSWSNSFLYQNCYGYAINKLSILSPGYSIWEHSGGTIETYPYDDTASISTIADWVVVDLGELGYIVNSSSTYMPNTQVSDHTFLICVRKDLQRMPYIDKYGNIVLLMDFHFMKLGEDGYWYHKPGGTNPLRYLHTPSSSAPWVSEGYDGISGEYYRYEDYTYDSEIYFIEYTTPHDYSYDPFGGDQHYRRCSICSDLTLLPCEYEYSFHSRGKHTKTCTICGKSVTEMCALESNHTGSGAHWSECQFCGVGFSEPCTASMTHYHDESLGDVHRLACTQCHNLMGETATSCTFEWIHTGMVDGENVHSSVCSVCNYVKISNVQCFYKNGRTCISCGSLKDIGSSGEVLREEISEVE